MGTCYICGKEHVDYRRTVHTGNSYRTGISSRGRVHTSVASHSGVRTVCASCALSIDYNAKKNAGAWGPVFGVSLIVLSLFILLFSRFFGFTGLISGILLCIFPSRNAKKNAEIWYKTHFNQYVDEIDIRAKQYQLKVEEAQNERRRIQEEQYRNEQKKLLEDKIQIKDLGKIFSERLNQEKDLLITKVQVYNKKFKKISIVSSDEVKRLVKELEDQENDCDKTLKKINKLCDDYIKQCKNSLSNKVLIENSVKNIEQIRNVLLNLINAFVSGIKNTENQVLRASLEISGDKDYICENEIIGLDITSIDNSILLIENEEKLESNDTNNQKKQKPLTEEEKKKVYMRDYIKEQLQRTDIEEIQKWKTCILIHHHYHILKIPYLVYRILVQLMNIKRNFKKFYQSYNFIMH